jgi:membrane protein
LAGLLGTKSLADEAGDLIFEAWPREVAKPIASEVHRVLTEQRGGVLTIGALLALYFSSSGVESLRVGLNRAYGLREIRPWWLTRLESIGYVVCGAFAMLAFALLVVLGPLIWRRIINVAPGLEPLSLTVAIGRIAITAFLLATVLVIAHKFVAAGRRAILSVLPGVAVTLVLWFLAGLGFGFYLDRFSAAYASTYGGLATAMVFLVFLYWLAAMFLFGGEINGTVIAARRQRLQARMLAKQAEARRQ